MAKKKNSTARKSISDATGIKSEGFDGKSDTGEFKKERAGPKRPGGTRVKGSASKQKTVSEAQEIFNNTSQNLTTKADEKSRKANQEFFSKHENEDEKNAEYVSQREETRALRKHRQHDSRARVKDSFIQSDGDFHGKTGFVEEAGAETAKSRKLDMLKKKAEKAEAKAQKARKKMPKRKEYKLVRHFDEKTGKTTYELQTNKVIKKPKPDNPITAANRRAMMEAQGIVHDKISEDEKDNSGVEAAHKTEESVETGIAKAGEFKRAEQAQKINKVAALEKKQFKAEVKFRYQKYLEEHPEVKKKTIQKRLQKQRIKREYAKAIKKGTQAKQAAGYAQKAATTTTNMARKIEEFARKHIGAIATIGLFGLFFLLISASISSCSAILNGGLSATMAGSYQSRPAQLDASDEAMTSREMALQNTIDNIETDYPDYDEYNYNLAEIGHNPFTLINYLSAIKVDVVASEVDTEIESLFEEMYELTLTPREETRTRTVTNDDGEEEEEEYTVQILDVELTRKPLEDIVEECLTGNYDASVLYAAYQQTNGALQQFYTPLDTDWYSLIKSYYGYRKNPITGDNQFHRGIDIAVPEGTEVYAGHDGTVTTAAYDDEYGNYIVITDSLGFTTKYAHLESMNVSAGQTVKHGAVIGKTGSTGAVTGSHLHLECLSDGEYYNPLFYFENGNGSIYGLTDPVGGSGDVAALIAEAENYLGYPYVWGGSNPSTSFDCSGFVCYVLTHSGYCNMPRTTAQGIYNQCQHISASEARAGDIIFFTGTYNAGNPVTHVGIYAGNGQMIHAGDPIKYSSINTSYWQSHFYGFGRPPGH
ncbi:CD1108 family mobile element protein [Oribacterium sp. NK2B42]|uniref:CD1108 family mobile element protein n=1 Tax=Oribacterium sp. NK2B42 TaxID=689781 RepID=UPI00040BFFF7|nr:peptidoglycan DD-metalloendopeptidase family protein [Oribacterium sp. NK2B42]